MSYLIKISCIILTHKETFRKQLRKNYDNDPFKAGEKYMHAAQNGQVKVVYSQKDGSGRYYAEGSVSLINLPRQFRHVLAKEYYVY